MRDLLKQEACRDLMMMTSLFAGQLRRSNLMDEVVVGHLRHSILKDEVGVQLLLHLCDDQGEQAQNSPYHRPREHQQ